VILSNKHGCDDQADTQTILQAMVVKNYLKANQTKKETKVLMQLLNPSSITHYELSLNSEETKNDQILCIESMKLSLIAKSCLCPGLVVLICNLIKSSIDCPKEIENQRNDPNFRWLYEYCCGKGNEIYRVEIPGSYCG